MKAYCLLFVQRLWNKHFQDGYYQLVACCKILSMHIYHIPSRDFLLVCGL
jgi:hypothetical protein